MLKKSGKEYGTYRGGKDGRSAKLGVDGRAKQWYNTICPVAMAPESACVAQLVEQLTRNEQVAGSSPATSSRLLACNARSFSMCKSSDNRYAVSIKGAGGFDPKSLGVRDFT